MNDDNYQAKRDQYHRDQSILKDQEDRARAEYLARQEAKRRANPDRDAHYKGKIEAAGGAPAPSSSSDGCTIS